jgi:hypothetical protein
VIPTTYPYQDFVVNKYKVIDRIALWLLIHGGDPAPFDGSTPNIREQATIELIKQLASTLKSASLAQNIQATTAGHRLASERVGAEKQRRTPNAKRQTPNAKR